MKTNIAAGLLLTGLICIAVSYFIGGNVSVEDEMPKEWTETYEQLSNDVHSRNRKKESNDDKSNVERLTEMHQEMMTKVEEQKQTGLKSLIWYSGLGLAAVGMCIQVWAMSEDSK
ncbi:MAG: hypothetical protein AAF497_18110 [Planctomycetota bacterium]